MAKSESDPVRCAYRITKILSARSTSVGDATYNLAGQYRASPDQDMPIDHSVRMASIRQANTKPELKLRRMLFMRGYRYRLHTKHLPGRPDLVFPARRKVIFVHGCFWHAHTGCKLATVPKTRTDFWLQKFAANRLRDTRTIERLRLLGWSSLVVWQCELQMPSVALAKVETFLGPPGNLGR